MTALLRLERRPRGGELLLCHCMLLDSDRPPREPATARLEQAIGAKMVGWLAFALVSPRGRRASAAWQGPASPA